MNAQQETKFSIIERSGIKCVKLENGPDIFILDGVKGTLLEHEKHIASNDGKTYLFKDEYEYLSVDGWDFPKTITSSCFSSENKVKDKIRQVIDPLSVKINQPIPPEIFIPKIPEGTRVHDSLVKWTYRATGLSDSKKEEFIAKELDRLFEEKDK